MNTQTMEGLIGARTNINIMNVPVRVYKEARLKNDTATMKRAMEYAGDYADRAEAYKSEADEGMKKDAEEARRKAKQELEETIRKRREERKELEEKIEEKRAENRENQTEGEKTGTEKAITEADTVELSEEGRSLQSGNDHGESVSLQETGAIVTDKEPTLYTSAGKTHTLASAVQVKNGMQVDCLV